MKNVLLIMLLLLMISCDNWLDLEPENDLIRQEFWQTKDDVDAVVKARVETD